MGIDPGTIVMGYGVLDERAGEVSLVGYGTVTARPKAALAERLRDLYHGTRKIVTRFHPDVLAVAAKYPGRPGVNAVTREGA